ncbi:hypothetical protein RI367_004190 [Sorochytrium milnesiophthora]
MLRGHRVSNHCDKDSAQDTADFLLTRSAFDKFMQNPTAVARFLQFLGTEDNDGQLRFYLSVLRVRSLLNQVKHLSENLLQSFIGEDALSPIDLPDEFQNEAAAQTKFMLGVIGDRTFCKQATKSVLESLFTESYPRFVQQQMVNFTRYRLSMDFDVKSDTASYNVRGLGNAFVLTDATRRENPIVMASDGFLALTEYDRDELHRNCNFLQGPRTSTQAIQRIRDAVQNRRAHVELLVNYRKSGQPFWNLLHIIPLCDVDGKTKFFFGAQIDVSDVIRRESSTSILSKAHASEPSLESFNRGVSFIQRLFSALKMPSTSPVATSSSSVDQAPVSSAESSHADLYLMGNIDRRDSSRDSRRNNSHSSNSSSSSSSSTVFGAGSQVLHETTTLSTTADEFVTTYSRVIVFDTAANSARRSDLKSCHIRYVSPEFYRATGYSTQLLGAPLSDVLSSSKSPTSLKQLTRALSKEEPGSFSCCCFDRDGNAIEAQLHVTPMKSTLDHRLDHAVLWIMVLVWPTTHRAATATSTAVENITQQLREDQAFHLLEHPFQD